MLNIETIITHKPFRKVFVTGMYHSGTCALINELNKRYTIPISPHGIKEFNDDGYWKHGNNVSPYLNDPSVLVIVLIKDPFFWIQSLKKDQKSITISNTSRSIHKKLLDSVKFNGYTYNNVIDIWNKYAINYLNIKKYPPENTLIIPYHEFLYHFKELQITLDTILPKKYLADLYFPPTMASSRPNNKKCRNRQEATEYYITENRYNNFSDSELIIIQRSLDKKILHRYGYKTDDFIGPKLTETNLLLLEKFYRSSPYQHSFPLIHSDNITSKTDSIYHIIGSVQDTLSLDDSYDSDTLEYILAKKKGKLVQKKIENDQVQKEINHLAHSEIEGDCIPNQNTIKNTKIDTYGDNNSENGENSENSEKYNEKGIDSDDGDIDSDIELEYIMAYRKSSLTKNTVDDIYTTRNRLSHCLPIYNPSLLEIQLTNNKIRLPLLHALLCNK